MLIENLPEEDMDLMYNYICDYSGESVMPRSDMPRFLHHWELGKANFYKAFGNEFILEREVEYTKSVSDLATEVRELVARSSDFTHMFYNRVDEIFLDGDYYTRSKINSLVSAPYYLASNVYDECEFCIAAKYTKSGHEIQVHHGMKVTKILAKICEEFDIPGFEEFRIKHSQILNQKRTKGTLCLSIHPMDFLTMSDNDCGWSSCLSWGYDGCGAGDYRGGSLEMMTSNCVIIAYLKSKRDMELPGGGYWNSKKWRALYIVDPKMIIGNRQYPFANDNLNGEVMRWLREIFNGKTGNYEDTFTKVKNRATTVIGEKTVRISIESAIMYNDFNENDAYVAADAFEYGEWYNINMSGPAICTCCCNVIEPYAVHSSSVVCEHCDTSWVCDWCGERHYEDDEMYRVGGREICRYCYEDCVCYCEFCNNEAMESDLFQVMIHNEACNKNYFIGMCDNCYVNVEEFFGKPTGYLRFDAKNVTKKGLVAIEEVLGEIVRDEILLAQGVDFE